MKHTRRIPALLLAAALLVSLLPPAGAAGTVTIGSHSEFLTFARNCTKDTWSVGVTVELTADLDLGGAGFTPIPIFQGTFHGNGHTISGLSFSDKGSRVGLFRTLTESAVVESLTVEGTLAPEGTAAQVGLLAGENHGVVRGCTTVGSVSGLEDVGGVVGLNGETGTVEHCVNQAAVSAPLNTGGIAGQNLGTLSACTNSGSINTEAGEEAPSSSGGIAGLSRGTITSCVNSGPVGYQHVGYNTGGIAGLQSGAISGCKNTGAILGRKDVGGIVGQFEPSVEVRYGPSPAESLNSNLSLLFDRLETLSDQISDIAGRSVEDAQAIQDAVGQIRDRAEDAGSEGLDDYRAMTDQLQSEVNALRDGLEDLRTHTGVFADAAWDELDTLLEQAGVLRKDLDRLLDSADSSLSQAGDALRDVIDDVDRQAQTIRTHLSALSSELDSLERYLIQVADCLLRQDLEGALAIPFPSLDLAGHLSAVTNALTRIPGLISDGADRLSAIGRHASRKLEAILDHADRAADKMHRAADRLVEAGRTLTQDTRQDMDVVSAQIDAVRTLLKNYSDTLGDKAQSAADDISGHLDTIQDRVDQMTQAAGADNKALHATAQGVIGALDQVRQSIYELSQEPEFNTADLSQDSTEGPGVVSSCTAAGTVEGDSNVGGIVGTVGAEIADDPEATVNTEDLELLADVYATLKAAVRGCRFDGSVRVKNDCGGGIAGRCSAGAIVDCAARGDITVGGDYCGGVAGSTAGSVLRCAALVDLDGESWLGGIAGLGGALTDCRSMVRAQGDGEYRGAIVGQAEDELTGNRYLLEDLAGLDGVDVTGMAEGLEFSAFAQLDHIPADFLTFSYRFTVDGQTVAEIPFSYGADLDQSLVPEAPARDGTYGIWPDYPVHGLIRSMVLEAQFTQPTATLSSGGTFPTLLAEGTFEPDALLSLEDSADLPALSGWQTLDSWSYAITGGQNDTVTLRLRAADTEQPAAAIRQPDGSWQVVQGQLDGSYLVIEGPAEGQIALLDQPPSSPLLIVLPICGGGAVLLAAVLLLHRRKKRRQNPPAAVN